jgi:LPXTG-motif cell wall-anchored protein
VKRTTLSLRRLSILVGGALLGMTAAIALAAPASAHHPIVSGKAVCESATGEWVVTWSVANSESDITGKLTGVSLEPAGTTVTNIVVDATLPKSGDGPLQGIQRVPPANNTGAKLTVDAEWWRGKTHITNSASGEVTFGGSCKQNHANPSASFSSNCDGSVIVTIANATDATKPAAFTVVGENGFSENHTVEPGKQLPVLVPAKSATKITVTADGKTVASGAWTAPEKCATPSIGVEQGCDSLTVTLENPAGLAPLEATLTPKGGEAKKVTVAPGKTEAVKFAAKAGTVVTLTIGDKSTDIPWQNPGNCTPGGGGGGPSLPVTGASLGGAIGAAGGLLAIGGALFVFFRRRRIRFTA